MFVCSQKNSDKFLTGSEYDIGWGLHVMFTLKSAWSVAFKFVYIVIYIYNIYCVCVFFMFSVTLHMK